MLQSVAGAVGSEPFFFELMGVLWNFQDGGRCQALQEKNVVSIFSCSYYRRVALVSSELVERELINLLRNSNSALAMCINCIFLCLASLGSLCCCVWLPET